MLSVMLFAFIIVAVFPYIDLYRYTVYEIKFYNIFIEEEELEEGTAFVSTALFDWIFDKQEIALDRFRHGKLKRKLYYIQALENTSNLPCGVRGELIKLIPNKLSQPELEMLLNGLDDECLYVRDIIARKIVEIDGIDNVETMLENNLYYVDGKIKTPYAFKLLYQMDTSKSKEIICKLIVENKVPDILYVRLDTQKNGQSITSISFPQKCAEWIKN